VVFECDQTGTLGRASVWEWRVEGDEILGRKEQNIHSDAVFLDMHRG